MNARSERTRGSVRQASHVQQLKKIRLFATDVDGTLTDGGMYCSDSGDQIRKFNAWDGLGLVLLKHAGIVVAFITMDHAPLVSLRADRLGISEVHQGVRDKLAALKELSLKYDLGFEEIAYMGDDVNDVPALQAVGFSATPANGRDQVRRTVRYVCNANGGEGAVREVADMILAAQRVECPTD